MAATPSLSLSLDPHKTHHSTLFAPIPKHPLLFLPKSHRHNFQSSFSSSHSSPSPPPPPSSSSSSSSASSSSSPSSTTKTTTRSYSFLEDPLRTGRFLSNEELEKLKILENFSYFQELESGSMWVRVMKPEEMDSSVKLLAESFADSMLLPSGYVSLLRFLVKQYLIERRAVMPHAVTLIGIYRGKEESGGEVEEEEQFAGTVEVCFDKKGANASPPTPTPPKNSPYICNMTVKKSLRRRGIGWHLLKASEELISQMSSSKEVYLHCRMIDTAPFNMYTKAGYNVVNTDSILILLTLQRRKHLMCKKLPVFINPSESDMSGSDEELPSQMDMWKL